MEREREGGGGLRHENGCVMDVLCIGCYLALSSGSNGPQKFCVKKLGDPAS